MRLYRIVLFRLESFFYDYRVIVRKISEERYLIFNIENSFFSKLDYR